MPFTNPQVGGQVLDETTPAGNYKIRELRERVTISANALQADLTKQLPAGAEVLWYTLKHGANFALFSRSQTTNVSQDGTMNIALIAQARTGLTTNVTTQNLGLGPAQGSAGAALAKNGATRGKPVNTTPGLNTGTSPVTLSLVPYAGTTAAGATTRYNTGSDTNSYHFGSVSGNVDVSVFYIEYEDNPDFS